MLNINNVFYLLGNRQGFGKFLILSLGAWGQTAFGKETFFPLTSRGCPPLNDEQEITPILTINNKNLRIIILFVK